MVNFYSLELNYVSAVHVNGVKQNFRVELTMLLFTFGFLFNTSNNVSVQRGLNVGS